MLLCSGRQYTSCWAKATDEDLALRFITNMIATQQHFGEIETGPCPRACLCGGVSFSILVYFCNSKFLTLHFLSDVTGRAFSCEAIYIFCMQEKVFRPISKTCLQLRWQHKDICQAFRDSTLQRAWLDQLNLFIFVQTWQQLAIATDIKCKFSLTNLLWII